MTKLKTLAVLALTVVIGTAGVSCSSKPKPRVPLPLRPAIAQDLTQLNQEGIQAYRTHQFDQARTNFQRVVAAVPSSAEAHYNLGLALFALGEGDRARDHFIEAANLAPGDKVIWDSPALRAYGSPDSNIPRQIKEQNYSNQRPTFGGGPRR